MSWDRHTIFALGLMILYQLLREIIAQAHIRHAFASLLSEFYLQLHIVWGNCWNAMISCVCRFHPGTVCEWAFGCWYCLCEHLQQDGRGCSIRRIQAVWLWKGPRWESSVYIVVLGYMYYQELLVLLTAYILLSRLQACNKQSLPVFYYTVGKGLSWYKTHKIAWETLGLML